MIVDSSALIAIIADEPEAGAFMQALARAPLKKMSAGTYLECAIVLDGKRDPVLSARLDDLLSGAAITIEPVTEDQARIARQAYRDFGKGSGHRAQLNFGDCFAYALAKDRAEPLLFKGTDFGLTDIRAAV
jgi:ribonuclease VapC